MLVSGVPYLGERNISSWWKSAVLPKEAEGVIGRFSHVM